MPRRGAFFFIGKKIIFVGMIELQRKRKQKGLSLGRIIWVEKKKKWEKKIGETEKKRHKNAFFQVIKTKNLC